MLEAAHVRVAREVKCKGRESNIGLGTGGICEVAFTGSAIAVRQV
ncbi:MAG: hypothetical protein OQK94_05765 [Gammaproteobacteria bacterium]|nr:hypothetical protein [Gammaproteobacteria bacterium]MCW8840261.1 hypothetical protein [Gammaproteobacteria bacterium]MCW8959480.1 hypothetical protein [Gammaproteobacteria bacterium]MCW8971773.1 hypothetical protein [Gammaproteobacteria bacterium]MCW8993231.1 hypothetical protein [Gammaproteobacteria bacterium]